MRAIDCHLHLYPAAANSAPGAWAAARGEGHWATLCARVRRSGRAVQGFPSVEDLLRAMDAAEVERGILQGWYWENHDTCREQNRFYAQCIQAHPDRLSACATFHPAAGEAAIEEELRWAQQNGFCGLGELSPHSQQVALDDQVWHAALSLAGRLGLPVVLHVTEPLGKMYPGRVSTPLTDFVRLAEQHEQTKFVLAHWGARLPLDPALALREGALRNLFYDTAASPLLYDFGVFREMIAAVGSDRVLYGSDYPLNLFPAEEEDPSIVSFVDKIRALDLSDAARRAVLGENARTLFGLK